MPDSNSNAYHISVNVKEAKGLGLGGWVDKRAHATTALGMPWILPARKVVDIFGKHSPG